MDKHPIFAILKVDILTGIKVCLEIFGMDILEMWCVSLYDGMYVSFRRVKRGEKKWQDNGFMRKCSPLPEGTE